MDELSKYKVQLSALQKVLWIVVFKAGGEIRIHKDDLAVIGKDAKTEIFFDELTQEQVFRAVNTGELLG